MSPIGICKFDRLTGTDPHIHELESLERFVEFFTFPEPPTVTKEQRSSFFSMAIYKPDTTRAKENVEALSGLVLDFDNTKDGQLKLPEFIEQLKQLELIYLYYTTWSHTEAHHRWRLILPFEKAVEVSLWRDVHDRVLKLLGNPVGLDQAASRDVARMWIMPCKAEGGAYQVGYETGGSFLDPHTLPPTPKPTPPVVIPSEFPKTTPADICEAIGFIEANCGYSLWLKMGMALQDQLGHSGLAIWNSWSSRGGEKYKGITEIQQKWNSFMSGHGVKIESLFYEARLRGYRGPDIPTVKYEITGTSDGSANSTSPQMVTEDFEEAEEFVDPIERCLAELEPFAVSDIFDFPCEILKSTFEWIQSAAPIPVPIFSFAASLSLLAFLKRNAVIGATDLRTNLYILIIGPSRSGKNNGLDCIKDALRALGIIDLVISGCGSAQGLMKQLFEREGVVYWVQDEVAHVFSKFQNKNAASYETGLEQKILTLYNCSFETTDKIKGEKIVAVEKPYLNIYGATTHQKIINNLSPEAAVSGLLARFLVFWQKPDEGLSGDNDNANRAMPQNLLDELRAINGQRGNKKVYFNDAAKEWFTPFRKLIRLNQRELCKGDSQVDSLVGNLPEQIIKLALIATTPYRVEVKTETYAAEYDSPITITLKDIQWATSVAIHCLNNNIAIAGNLAENKNEKYINKIVECLKIYRGKWVRRCDLCKYIRYALIGKQVDDLLEPLVESRKILKSPAKRSGGNLYCFAPTPNKRKIT